MSEGSTSTQAKVLTVSDGVMPRVRATIRGVLGWSTGWDPRRSRSSNTGWCRTVIEEVSNALSYMAYGFNGLIVTTGGTGFGPRDLTPEATKRMLDRNAPGFAEAMRAVSPLGPAVAERGRDPGRALILNVAGSPRVRSRCWRP